MDHHARQAIRLGISLALVLTARGALAQEKPPAPTLAPDRLAAIDRISADSLKGHLSFIASDLLEGRDTPSRGLDLAAEYIAAQFRRAGLEPVGDDGYFQTANWELSEPDPTKYLFQIARQDERLSIAAEDFVSDRSRFDRLDVPPTLTYLVDLRTVGGLDLEKLAGRVVIVLPDGRNPAATEEDKALMKLGADLLGKSRATLILAIINRPRPAQPALRNVRPGGRLNDPNDSTSVMSPPQVSVYDPKLAQFFENQPVGPNDTTVTVHGGATIRPVKLRNVAGLLRGSDPALKDTCVMVTAHYDHLGVRGTEGTDRIFNGANDDGSGTVSVIELATSLATLKERPKRSILFVTFFGEEKGLLGSRYYGRNPIFPVEKTVADVNLEQVGRTDDTEGPQLLKASMTGFGYSDVSTAFVKAGEAEGVAVVKHPRNSDAFFGRSDNQALADLGVPAHTLCVAFQYPDYHGATDHWDKVDYANMARIDRMVARALLTLADDPVEPRWEESNPRAAKYRKAWMDRRAK